MEIQIESSHLKSAAYNKTTGTLVIRFLNGQVYEYDSVPEQIFEDFKDSESKGKFLHRVLKNNYRYRRV